MSDRAPAAKREDWAGVPVEEYDRILSERGGAGGWSPPGPLSAAMVASDAWVRGLAGPYGNGKTATCMVDGLLKLRAQPIAHDGVRYQESIIVADSYGSMNRNTLRTWFDWFPKEWGLFKGANERPSLHQLRMRDEYGEMRWSVDFVAIGEHAAEDVMDGFEPGHAFINGITRMNQDVLTFLLGRVKRGGSIKLLGEEAFRLKWNGITFDFNKANDDHWLHPMLELDPDVAHVTSSRVRSGDFEPNGKGSARWEYYDFPGGLDADAENLQNLAADYYASMVEDWRHDRPKIERLVHNKWGFAHDGEAVYPAYGPHHRAGRELAFDPSRDLYLGLDGGQTLHPAAIFCQRDDEGQWRALLELCPGRMGASAFADLLVRAIQENFPGARITAFGDPTMDAGADQDNGQLSWLDTVELALGFPVQVAPTNEFDPRREAVMRALAHTTPDGRPGLIISTACPSLISGFGGKYFFPTYKEGGKEKTRDRPNKDHPYSDVHDALQYVILSVEGLAWVQSGSGRRHEQDAPRVAPAASACGWGWSPLD